MATAAEPPASPVLTDSEAEPPAKGRYRVLTLSTLGFTLLFAVWLQFGILGVKIKEEFGLTSVQFYWLTAVPVLNGSIWRLATGILTDRIGGRWVFTYLVISSAIPTYFVSKVQADQYWLLLVLAFLVGFSGNSFSSGIAWNSAWFPRSQQGFALGVFGAGNVGASLTKLIGPGIIAATAGSVYFGIQGGWRLIPVIYAVMLLVMGVALWVFSPRHDRVPGKGVPLRQQLRPLKQMRVWRFSLYYVVVFGAYVALASALPLYYKENYGVELWTAGLLTALYIFPASLLRPLGGWMSDRVGARRIMYWTFAAMLVTSGILMMPNGFITVDVLESKSASGQVEVLPWNLGIVPFTIVLVLLGCAMGIGKAAVYKHIPEYFPKDVGAVGGVVGMLGALGGFFLLPIFGYFERWTGLPTAMFAVLFAITLISAVWMHVTVVRMLHARAPELKDKFEHPDTSTVGATS